MSKNLIIIIFAAVLILGCNDKAPSCSTLSWGETKIEETGFDLKYSAGNQCENINDYWDVDVDEIIPKILKMKFVIDKCVEPEADETVECPEFVPETIEFGEVVGCKFSTPPSERDDCLAGPLIILFSSNSYFENIGWTFDVENPGNPAKLGSKKDEIYLNCDNMSLSDKRISLTLNWTETSNEDVEEEKKIYAEYYVEIKE